MIDLSKIKANFLLYLAAVLGVVVSALLLYQHELLALGGKSSLGICDISKTVNCAGVISSDWSSFLGISLAAWGLFFYLLIFSLAQKLEQVSAATKKTIELIILALTAVAVLLSIGLFFISKYVIGAICPLCVLLYLINIFAFVLILRRTLRAGLKEAVVTALAHLRSTAFWDLKSPGTAADFSIVSIIRITILCGILTLVPAVSMKIFAGKNYSPQAKDLNDWPRTGRLRAVDLRSGINSDVFKGSRAATIQIVEFADLQCSFCRIFYLELDDLIRKFPGKLQVVFKNFPLDASCNINVPTKMHPEACSLAHGFRCLEEQDLFWAGMDILSALPVHIHAAEGAEGAEEAEEAPLTDMDQVLSQIDLDRSAWDQCMESGRHWTKIREDVAQAQSLGVSGTPAVWVNGRRFAGLNHKGLTKLITKIIQDAEQK